MYIPIDNDVSLSGWQWLQWVSPSRARLGFLKYSRQKLVALEFITSYHLNEVQMVFDTKLVKIPPLPNYFSLSITFIKNIPYG